MNLGTSGEGYEEIRHNRSCLTHHRLLAYAWGYLDSPFFERDPREIHHRDSIPWHNSESNLEAVSPEEHNLIQRRKFAKSTELEEAEQ